MIRPIDVNLFISVAAAAVGGIRWWTWRARQQSARSWPVASGHIESAKARRSERGEPGEHVAVLVHSYSDGKDYCAGQCLRPFWRKSRAEKFVMGLRGRSIVVRYKADPTSALTDAVIEGLERSPREQVLPAEVNAFRAPPLR